MKKTVTWLVIGLCMTFTGFSQKIALIGGVTGSGVNEKNELVGWDSTTKPNYSGRTGIQLGFMADVPLLTNNKWFLQTGIIYQPKGRKFFQIYDTATAELTDTFLSRRDAYLNYIEFPINIAYKVSIGKNAYFVFSGGPYFSFFYKGNEESQTRFFSTNDFIDNDEKYSTGRAPFKVKTMDAGINLRAGIETRSIYFSGFFSRGLTSFYQAPYEGTFKHKVSGVTLGFWLNKTGVSTQQPVAVPKSKDRDQDGITDEMDNCPDFAGTAITNGCPDKDADAIADAVDNCPDMPGVARFQGCPIPDTDKDGIDDEIDQCPLEKGTAAYKGCPVPDSDKDGINDETDACPQQTGVPEFNGCPIPDTDQDGVNDKEDKCPEEAGTAANNGCPELDQKIVEKVNLAARKIFYTANSDVISVTSFAALDEVATILRENPDLHLEIAGHSDNSGMASHNLSLSGKRAVAVKKYLEAAGIEPVRISARGYGDKQPLLPNDTEAGRSQNRRVELNLVKKDNF